MMREIGRAKHYLLNHPEKDGCYFVCNGNGYALMRESGGRYSLHDFFEGRVTDNVFVTGTYEECEYWLERNG